MRKINKNIFLTAVHGNEFIGLRVLKSLAKTVKLDWVIGNPQALNKKKRFVNVDLNRVAPGKMYSKFYEYRRAYFLVRYLSKFQTVIDIHDTVSDTGIFAILTKPTKANLLLARKLPIKRVVIWYMRTNKKRGPIARYLNSAIAIECGPRNKATEKKLKNLMPKIIKGIESKTENKSQKIFKVYGKLMNAQVKKNYLDKFRNFRKIKYQNEEFYPIMIGQYEKILCFKMKKLIINN